MKKILLIIFCLFLFSGCDITYNLNVGEDFFEDIDIYEIDDSIIEPQFLGLSSSELVNFYLKKPIPILNSTDDPSESMKKVDGVKYYDVKNISTDIQEGLSFSANFKGNEYVDSKLGNFGVNISRENIENGIKLSANNFKVFNSLDYLDTITINITSKYKVLDHNADEVNGKTYTWVVNRGNYKNKTIEISFKMNNKLSESDSVMLRFALIMTGIVVTATLLYFIFKTRFNKKNSI